MSLFSACARSSRARARSCSGLCLPSRSRPWGEQPAILVVQRRPGQSRHTVSVAAHRCNPSGRTVRFTDAEPQHVELRTVAKLHSRLIPVDTSDVSKRVQIALLATATLASLAVAGVRITHAARSGAREPQLPVYGTTPAAEAATLEALHPPAGFRRFPHCSAGDACFIERKPIALEVAPVRRLVQALGVTLVKSIGHPPIECGTLFRKVCRAEGTIGTESVWVWVQPPEVKTHERRAPRSRRTFHAFRVLPGTEIDVSVLGHCLHPNECEQLQHEQATEALSSPR